MTIWKKWPLVHLYLMETSLHGSLDNLIHIPLSLEKTQYLNNKISTMKMSCQNGDPKRASMCLGDREKGRMGWEGVRFVRFVRFVNQYLGILWRGLRSGSLPTDGYWIRPTQGSTAARKERTLQRRPSTTYSAWRFTWPDKGISCNKRENASKAFNHLPERLIHVSFHLPVQHILMYTHPESVSESFWKEDMGEFLSDRKQLLLEFSL